MSKAATITSQDNAQNIRIEYNVGMLDLNLKISKASGFADHAAFLGRLTALEIEVNKQTKAGMINVLNRGKVLQYAELAQANRGLIIVDASVLTAPTLKTAIELTDFGSIPLKDGEFFEVNFFNVPSNAGEVVSFDVNAVDMNQRSAVHNVYEKHYFNAGAPREVSLVGVKTIAIPTEDCDKIELVYGGGNRVQYTKSDLEAIQRDGLGIRNYIKLSTGTLVNELNSLILHNVSACQAVKITTLNNTNVLLLKHHNI
jgi:hypothetical protein